MKTKVVIYESIQVMVKDMDNYGAPPKHEENHGGVSLKNEQVGDEDWSEADAGLSKLNGTELLSLTWIQCTPALREIPWRKSLHVLGRDLSPDSYNQAESKDGPPDYMSMTQARGRRR